MPRARASVSGLRTDNGKNSVNPDECKFWKTWWCYANYDMMKCNTQAKDMATQRLTGRHLAQWSRGVTTLHHYKRSRPEISENGRGREEVKTKLLLWPMSETKEPWEVEQIERKNRMKMNKVENTPLEKSYKEHYKNLVGWKAWNKSLTNQREYETTGIMW